MRDLDNNIYDIDLQYFAMGFNNIFHIEYGKDIIISLVRRQPNKRQP